MSSEQSAPTIPDPILTPEELRAILRFMFFIRRPAMAAQLIGIVLATQTSAQDLYDALLCLEQVTSVRSFKNNLEELVDNAPALEIVCRYARRLEGKRPCGLPRTASPGVKFVPNEAVVEKLLEAFAAETDQKFEDQLQRPTR
jgi:hypothetical protein